MSSGIHAIGRALARMGNKNVFYKQVLGETQHKHVNVHKGAPSDKFSIPALYITTTLVVVAALDGAWDMMMNKNRKVE